MFESILGLVMFYTWIHSIIIIGKQIKVEGYDKAVVIIGLVGIVAFVFGALN